MPLLESQHLSHQMLLWVSVLFEERGAHKVILTESAWSFWRGKSRKSMFGLSKVKEWLGSFLDASSLLRVFNMDVVLGNKGKSSIQHVSFAVYTKTYFRIGYILSNPFHMTLWLTKRHLCDWPWCPLPCLLSNTVVAAKHCRLETD